MTEQIERALCEGNGCVWGLDPASESRQQWRRDVAVVRAAVIEECAAIAESFNVTPAFDLPCSPFDRTEAIASAIRALAD